MTLLNLAMQCRRPATRAVRSRPAPRRIPVTPSHAWALTLAPPVLPLCAPLLPCAYQVGIHTGITSSSDVAFNAITGAMSYTGLPLKVLTARKAPQRPTLQRASHDTWSASPQGR